MLTWACAFRVVRCCGHFEVVTSNSSLPVMGVGRLRVTVVRSVLCSHREGASVAVWKVGGWGGCVGCTVIHGLHGLHGLFGSGSSRFGLFLPLSVRCFAPFAALPGLASVAFSV